MYVCSDSVFSIASKFQTSFLNIQGGPKKWYLSYIYYIVQEASLFWPNQVNINLSEVSKGGSMISRDVYNCTILERRINEIPQQIRGC